MRTIILIVVGAVAERWLSNMSPDTLDALLGIAVGLVLGGLVMALCLRQPTRPAPVPLSRVTTGTQFAPTGKRSRRRRKPTLAVVVPDISY